MIRNIWKKILSVGLATAMVFPSVAYAKTQSTSSVDSQEIASAGEQENDWLAAVRSVALVVIDAIEEEGLLDNELTPEGYENLRAMAEGITDPEALKESLSQVTGAGLTVVLQIAISVLTPYCTQVSEFLDSIGIGSDEIIELAGLIPEDYRPIVDEVLFYSGLLGITDPYETVYPLYDKERSSTWAIYIYAAGNDLETRGWAFSHDLEEIMQTSLPENVKVVIEGGGAACLHNDYMDSEYQSRCVYDSEGMHVISQTPRQNMGDQKTLESFLQWCTGEYPADNTMLVFWGHGAATDGVCLDENYEHDSITLTELEGAVDNVFGKDRKEPVFDVVGFDACLMAAIETASVCSRFASYLAASEETEPGNGWAYHSILAQIASTPQLTMEQLGSLMCSSYLFNNKVEKTDDQCTFSFVDLKKADGLIEAYDDLGKAILDRYREDPSIKDEVFHIAADAEAYASISGFRMGNQIDLGDFANYLKPLFPEESGKVLDALEDCVLCEDNGAGRDHSRGLSCTFPFITAGESLDFYKATAASESFLTYFDEAGYFAQSENGS